MAHEKTLIGVLASHDSRTKNEALASVFEWVFKSNTQRRRLQNFRFVFTGGTYLRLMNGEPVAGQAKSAVKHQLCPGVIDFLHKDCGIVRLPTTKEGGVILLSSLITQRKVSIVWPFFSPLTTHLLYPENLALLRLGDQWRVKKLMNSGSVREWLQCESDRDVNFNLQGIPMSIGFSSGTKLSATLANVGSTGSSVRRIAPRAGISELPCRTTQLSDTTLRRATIALISHDEMKGRMADFVIDYEHELAKFKNILATGTTGKLIQEVAPSLARKVYRYHSGPKGGDIELATEVLFNRCHVVIFFVDPLHPHPHAEDIRVVFGACMIQDKVRMLSNESQARAWMDRRVRGT